MFNCNNVKSSYSSLPNCKTVINNHDKNILHESEKHSLCNYRDEAICPINGRCQHEVSIPDIKQKHLHFFGFTEHTFMDTLCEVCLNTEFFLVHIFPHSDWIRTRKNSVSGHFSSSDRLYKQKNSFKYKPKRSSAEFSKFIWGKKKENLNVKLDLIILDNAKPNSPASKNCTFCLKEKYHIIFATKNLLNKRNRLVLKIRHENKFYFANYKDIRS